MMATIQQGWLNSFDRQYRFDTNLKIRNQNSMGIKSSRVTLIRKSRILFTQVLSGQTVKFTHYNAKELQANFHRSTLCRQSYKSMMSQTNNAAYRKCVAYQQNNRIHRCVEYVKFNNCCEDRLKSIVKCKNMLTCSVSRPLF